MRMWSLQALLSGLCIALSCVSSTAGLIRVFGYEGREAHVSCGYGAGYQSYEKYLCKGGCGSDDDVLIRTTGGKTDKYSISDDKGTRSFTTTISDLSLTDAGTYWCGVTRNGKDIYSEVRLQVVKDTCCDQSTKVQSYETDTASFGCSYEPGYEGNLKYFCRGQQPSTCLQQALVTSYSTRNGSIALTDDTVSRRFTVTIGDLSQTDNGSYLCGVRKNTGLDVFSAVELQVKEWCCVTTTQLSGTVGHPLTMRCTYSPHHRDKRKFFCRGEERSACTDVVTSGSRFTLQGDVSSESFSVTVTELRADDAATYWCGSDPQWSVGQYTKIQLSVVFPRQTSTQSHDFRDDTPPRVTSSEDYLTSSYSASFYPAVFGVPAALLVLTLVLVIVYKCKHRKVQGAGNNVTAVKNISVTETVMDNSDVYTNEDIIFHSKQPAHKPQRPNDHYDNGSEDPDSLYQNFSTADDIYCNEVYARTKK